MKALNSIIVFLFLLVFVNKQVHAQEEFSSLDELNTYVFQKTDLKQVTKGYFLNYLLDMTPEKREELFNQFSSNKMNLNKIIGFGTMLEQMDVPKRFKADSLFFPIMNELYSNNGYRTMRIPLIIADVNLSYINDETFNNVFLKHVGSQPFDELTKEQIQHKNITFSGIFVDTLVNNHIQIYWNREMFLSNTRKAVDRVQLIIRKDTFELAENAYFELDNFYSYSTPLTQLKIKVTFSDGSHSLSENDVFFLKYTEKERLITVGEFTAKAGNYFPWSFLNGGFEELATISGYPELDFNILWGCDPQDKKTLDKPFIMVAGWGPYTDKNFINNAQGWPSSIQDFYWSINQKGYVDSLVGAGYDVIFAKFNPPNTNTIFNSLQLEKLIKLVNAEKFSQGSYQENVISGYSAGSMCVRLTLERMEYAHLQGGGEHHHCKLFVSFDGEQGGANVPLGVQHAVKYLKDYHLLLNSPLPNATIYALFYILNAPLSQELLRYFYTETGTSNNKKQGAHPARVNFMQLFTAFNHPKNTHNPYYPAFTRNISLSNGTSVRTANSPLSTYFPYTPEIGKQIFYNDKVTDWLGVIPVNHLKTQVYLLGRGDGLVFKNERKKIFGGWSLRMEAYTNNPLILDNAPGGTTFISDPNKCDDPNIMYQVLRRLENKTQYLGIGDADNVQYNAMYSFTPTFLTHDIRNFTPTNTAGGRLLYYDMKAQGLMYQKIEDAISNVNQSSFYGYPHLAHPNDHYTTYTPFDAVFAWDKVNTVHIPSGEAQWNDNGKNLNCTQGLMDVLGGVNPNHNRWEQIDSPLRAEMRSFLLGEADVHHAYIQNRRYGWNANPSSIYKADIVSKHQIFAGDSVTQRTDFKAVEIAENADVRFIACEGITFKPGVHIKAGAKLHAKIDPQICTYCSYSGISHHSDGRHPYTTEEYTEEKVTDAHAATSLFKLYPNPSSTTATIEIVKEDIHSFAYDIFDISGKLIERGVSEGKIKQLSLPQGMYIVKVKTNELWESKKLVMY